MMKNVPKFVMVNTSESKLPPHKKGPFQTSHTIEFQYMCCECTVITVTCRFWVFQTINNNSSTWE